MNTSVPDQLNGSTPSGGGVRPRFGELAADALRYWEPRRLLYNAVLLAVVCVHFYAAWPGSKAFLARDPLFLFFILAVLANIAYCAAYAADLFVQFSGCGWRGLGGGGRCWSWARPSRQSSRISSRSASWVAAPVTEGSHSEQNV